MTDDLRDRLERRWLSQRTGLTRYTTAYDNTAPPPLLDREQLEVLGDRVKAVSVNYARLAVDVVAQRLQVSGFRSAPGEVVDRDLAGLWQAVNLDESSQLVILDALVTGAGYLSLGIDDDGRPLVSAESPAQVVVEYDPATRRIVAALKRWLDLDGYVHSLLMTATEHAEYVTRTAGSTDPAVAAATLTAYSPGAQTLLRRVPNPLGIVPVVPFVNRPRTTNPYGESEIVDVLPVVEALSKVTSDLVVTSDWAAAPKRWATGLMPDAAFGDRPNEEQVRTTTENIRTAWEKSRGSRFVAAFSEGVRFGTFDAADLTSFDTAVKLLTGQIAALAALPPYYVSLEATQATSADAIRAAESRITAKVRQRQRWFSGPFEDAMRMLVMIRDGQPDSRLDDLQTLWVDPEPSTIAQTSDAVSKLVGAGILDVRTALETLDVDPVTIDRLTANPSQTGVM